MMHVRFSRVAADPPVLAWCVGFLTDEASPVLESQHGSLGVSLLEEPGVVIFESFWTTYEALKLNQETEASFRGELGRRVDQLVRADDYQVAVFERVGQPGEAVQLTRMEVKPAGLPDVVEVYGDTVVPRLAGTPGFREALLFADPARGQLISQTAWRDTAARAADPSVAEMLRGEVLNGESWEIGAEGDYRLVFDSAWKPGPTGG